VQVEGQPDDVVRAYLDYTERARGIRVHDLGDRENRGERLGSGELEIVDCILVGKDGRTQEEFEHGEPVVVRIDYRCRKEVEAAVFGVSIYTNAGVRVTTSDSPPIRHLPPPGETGSMRLIFPQLGLCAGKYDLTVAVRSPDTREYRPYDHYQRAYNLKVTGASPDGLVELPHRWESSSLLSDVDGEDDHWEQKG
jgi:hypothetical protein